MDFILRSQADSVIRLERWAERVGKEIDSLVIGARDLLRTQREHEKKYEKFRREFAQSRREFAKSQQEFSKSQREYAESQRNYEKRMRALESSDRKTNRRVRGIKDLMRLFSKRADIQSNRVDRLERSGR